MEGDPINKSIQIDDYSPPIGIIVLNWNNYSDTFDCLSSIKCLSYPEYTVYLVDNSSSDGSFDRLVAEFDWCKPVRNTENMGFAGGCNRGIEEALKDGCEYVLLLNNDTVVDEDFLNLMVAVAESDEQIGIVGSTIRKYDSPHKIESIGGSISKWTGRHTANTDVSVETITENGLRIQEAGYVSGACLLANSDLINSIGPLDDTFFMYTEEIDWCERARKAGYKVVVAIDSTVYHRTYASNRDEADEGIEPFVLFFSLRNNMIFARKHTSGVKRYTYYLAHTLRICKYIIVALVIHRDRTRMRAILDSLLWHLMPHNNNKLTKRYIPEYDE